MAAPPIMPEKYMAGFDAGIHLERDPAEVDAPGLLDAVNVELNRPSGVVRKRLGSRYYGDDFANGLITPSDFAIGVNRVVKMISAQNSVGTRYLFAFVLKGTTFPDGSLAGVVWYNKPDVDENWTWVYLDDGTFTGTGIQPTLGFVEPLDHAVMDDFVVLPTGRSASTSVNYGIYFGPDESVPILMPFGSQTPPGSSLSPIANGAGVLTGTYGYVQTFFAPWTQSETKPSAPESVTVTDKQVQVTVSAVTNNEFQITRIYRTIAGGSTFFLVAERSSGGNWTDNTADDALGSEQPPQFAGSAPTARCVAHHKSRLFWGNKTKTDAFGPAASLGYYSEPGRAGNVDPLENFFRFGGKNSEAIRSIFPLYDQLYAASESKIFNVNGLAPPYQIVEVVNEGGYGAINPNTVVEIEGRIFALSRKGPFMFDGTTPQGLEGPLLPVFRERQRIEEANQSDLLSAREVPFRWTNPAAGTVTVADVRMKFFGTTTTPATVTLSPNAAPTDGSTVWVVTEPNSDKLVAVTDALDSTFIFGQNQDAVITYPLADMPAGAGTTTSIKIRIRSNKVIFSGAGLNIGLEIKTGAAQNSAGTATITPQVITSSWQEVTLTGLNISAADMDLATLTLTNDLGGDSGQNNVLEIEVIPTYDGSVSLQEIATFNVANQTFAWRLNGGAWCVGGTDLIIPSGGQLSGGLSPHTASGQPQLEDGNTYTVTLEVDTGSGYGAPITLTDAYVYTLPGQEGRSVNWAQIDRAWAIDHWPTREYWLAVPSSGSNYPDVIYALDYEQLFAGRGISWRRILAPAASGIVLPLKDFGGVVPKSYYPLLGDWSGRVWVYQWPRYKDHLGVNIAGNDNFGVCDGTLSSNTSDPSPSPSPDPSPAGTWTLTGGAALITIDWGHQGELVTLRSRVTGKTYTGIISGNTTTELFFGAWLDSQTPPDGVYDWSLYGIEAAIQSGWFNGGTPKTEKRWQYLLVQQTEPWAQLDAELLFADSPGNLTETHRRRWCQQLRGITGGRQTRRVPILGRSSYASLRIGNFRSSEPFTLVGLGWGFTETGSRWR